MKFLTNPDHAKIVQKLEAALLELPLGGELAYPALNAIAGTDVQRKRRYLLDKARENAEKARGCIFGCAQGRGLECLPYERATEVGLATIRKIRKGAKRGQKRLGRLNGNSLTSAQHSRVVGYGAMLGAIALIADGRKATAVAAVADTGKPIPPENILRMFRAE